MAYGSLKIDTLIYDNSGSDVSVAISGIPSATLINAKAPIASPTFTGTVTIPSGASIAGYATTASLSNHAETDQNQTFTKAQRGSITALSGAGTLTADFSLSNNFSITLSGATTFANPSNLVAGQAGCIVITQASSSLYSLSWGSNWKFVGGTAPDATQSANAVDLLAYFVESSSRITARLLADVK